MGAAEVENVGVQLHRLEHPKDARLQTTAGGPKGLGKALIESAVDAQQTFDDFSLHLYLSRNRRIIAVAQNWNEAREYTPAKLSLAREILEEVRAGLQVSKAVRAHPMPEGGYVGKHMLVHAYR